MLQFAVKAQKELNETLEEAKNRKEALRIKGNDLIAKLTSVGADDSTISYPFDCSKKLKG